MNGKFYILAPFGEECCERVIEALRTPQSRDDKKPPRNPRAFDDFKPTKFGREAEGKIGEAPVCLRVVNTEDNPEMVGIVLEPWGGKNFSLVPDGPHHTIVQIGRDISLRGAQSAANEIAAFVAKGCPANPKRVRGRWLSLVATCL